LAETKLGLSDAMSVSFIATLDMLSHCCL